MYKKLIHFFFFVSFTHLLAPKGRIQVVVYVTITISSLFFMIFP